MNVGVVVSGEASESDEEETVVCSTADIPPLHGNYAFDVAETFHDLLFLHHYRCNGTLTFYRRCKLSNLSVVQRQSNAIPQDLPKQSVKSKHDR